MAIFTFFIAKIISSGKCNVIFIKATWKIINRETILDDFTQVMLERESLVLELLIQEGYFEYGGKLHENTKNDIV